MIYSGRMNWLPQGFPGAGFFDALNLVDGLGKAGNPNTPQHVGITILTPTGTNCDVEARKHWLSAPSSSFFYAEFRSVAAFVSLLVSIPVPHSSLSSCLSPCSCSHILYASFARIPGRSPARNSTRVSYRGCCRSAGKSVLHRLGKILALSSTGF